MIKNYFKIAWRNLIRDRQFSLLNLLGLSTGLACALLIWLWISDEKNMDKYNEKDAQIFQVMQNMPQESGIQTMEYTAGLLANAMATELPEVEHAATVVPASWFSMKGIITVGNTRLKTGGQFISKDYFKIFDCPFVEGDNSKLISDKNSIAISEDLAMKVFHSTKNCIGKTIQWSLAEFNGTYTVTGVFKDQPPNATEKFDVLFNFDLFIEKRPGMKSWDNSDPSTYLLLKKGTNIALLNQKIKDFEKTKQADTKKKLFLAKFSDKYLYGQYKNGVQSGGRITYVRLFSMIAIFILVIACINFMNLSTAKAVHRIKEVGLKKVMGARRINLVFQYLGESIFMSFISLLIAGVIIVLLLPAFNSITGKSLTFDFSYGLVFSILLITLFTGVVAGSYPALYISGFKPASVLKGKLKTSLGELWVRKGLVVFQFSLSIIFIIVVLIVYKQTSYIQSKNLGYNRDNIIDFTIPLDFDSASISRAVTFVNELKNIPGVVSAGSHAHDLNGDHGSISDFHWPGKDPNKTIDFANLEMGAGFIETVGIKIKEGRNFSNNANAQHEIVFNESAIKEMGLKDPVGKMIKFWDRERQIVGIAEDFNFESLYQTVKPCFFQVYPVAPNIVVKIKAGTERQTIAKIGTAFASFNKGLPFDYKFLDEEYQAIYTSENRVAILSKYFAGLAILISCLGLFGLAAFTAQRRQKEIGIRKVVGATVSNVVFLLSKEFIRLVILALLIAFPLAWWGTNEWLHGFAYHIPVGADVFIIATLTVLVITIVTISFQAIKAAVANPVKSLRTE